jgi:uncharacterized protein affecting Mg2+/Co2+ transport
MRRALLALLLILLSTATVAFCLSEITGAATTGTVSPSVTVSNTLSLTLEGTTNVQWESKSAGTTQTGTIQAKVGANTNWTLTVKRSSDTSVANCGLMGSDGNNFIPSSNFRYTSAAGSPAPAGSGVSTTQFDTSDTNVWTEGIAIGECQVAVTYNLQIPANQKPQAYSATHTYTLVPS